MSQISDPQWPPRGAGWYCLEVQASSFFMGEVWLLRDGRQKGSDYYSLTLSLSPLCPNNGHTAKVPWSLSKDISQNRSLTAFCGDAVANMVLVFLGFFPLSLFPSLLLPWVYTSSHPQESMHQQVCFMWFFLDNPCEETDINLFDFHKKSFYGGRNYYGHFQVCELEIKWIAQVGSYIVSGRSGLGLPVLMPNWVFLLLWLWIFTKGYN